MTTYALQEDLLDKLASFEPGDSPVLSVYLDARPNARGRDDFERFLRKEFRARAKSYGDQTPERESFDQDVERILSYLREQLRPGSNGVAIFACRAVGLFEAAQFEAPFPEHGVFVARAPHLYPLAHLLDHYRRYAAVVADTNSARIYVFGCEQPLKSHAVQNLKVKRHKAGGWSQMHYQRHVDNVHLLHAKEVADLLTRVVRQERLEHVVLGGDEVIMPLLRRHLPADVNDRIIEILNLTIRTPEHEVLAATLEAFRRHDARTDAENVARLLDEFRGGRLGVVGARETLAALVAGQVDNLVIAATPAAIQREDGMPGDDELAGDLVSRARQTGARVTFIEDPSLLAEVGGVGALLRYRLASDVPVPSLP